MIPVKVPFENDVADADEMDFKSIAGVPQVLELEDGARIEFGHVVTKVFRLRDKKKEDGTPIYICVGNAVINLKSKKEVTVSSGNGA